MAQWSSIYKTYRTFYAKLLVKNKSFSDTYPEKVLDSENFCNITTTNTSEVQPTAHHECRPCYVSCDGCHGNSSADCESCDPSYYRHYTLLQNSNSDNSNVTFV